MVLEQFKFFHDCNHIAMTSMYAVTRSNYYSSTSTAQFALFHFMVL